MSSILGGFKNVVNYLDDILLHNITFESHFLNIQTVINRLHKQDISVNFDKSQFDTREVKFLGTIINDQGMKPGTSKVETLLNYTPRNTRQVMRLLGFINWFSSYLFNVSRKTEFLSNKTRKTEKFIWTQEDSQRTKSILAEIAKQPQLVFPFFQEPFFVNTDASEASIAGIVYQKAGIVGVYSKKLNHSQSLYGIQEK